MTKEERVLETLLKQKEKVQEIIYHAIQNEHNSFADDGSKRLEQLREEMKRINEEISEL